MILSSLLSTNYLRPSRLFQPRPLSLPWKLPTSSSFTSSDTSASLRLSSQTVIHALQKSFGRHFGQSQEPNWQCQWHSTHRPMDKPNKQIKYQNKSFEIIQHMNKIIGMNFYYLQNSPTTIQSTHRQDSHRSKYSLVKMSILGAPLSTP